MLLLIHILIYNFKGDKMKYIETVSTDTVELEVIECGCGYHMGIDGTYLDQVGDLKFECPVCQATIDTSLIEELAED
jgi:hypothetical protein